MVFYLFYFRRKMFYLSQKLFFYEEKVLDVIINTTRKIICPISLQQL